MRSRDRQAPDDAGVRLGDEHRGVWVTTHGLQVAPLVAHGRQRLGDQPALGLEPTALRATSAGAG
jgi:hypothetical protein